MPLDLQSPSAGAAAGTAGASAPAAVGVHEQSGAAGTDRSPRGSHVLQNAEVAALSSSSPGVAALVLGALVVLGTLVLLLAPNRRLNHSRTRPRAIAPGVIAPNGTQASELITPHEPIAPPQPTQATDSVAAKDSLAALASELLAARTPTEATSTPDPTVPSDPIGSQETTTAPDQTASSADGTPGSEASRSTDRREPRDRTG